MNAPTVAKKKKSNGQLFKEQFHYSKSMKRNMLQHGLAPTSDSLADYRDIRKKARKERAIVKKGKHKTALAGRVVVKSSSSKPKK